MRKKTNEEFLKQLKSVNSNINPLEEYKGTETPIDCECLICHTVWKARPNNIFSKGYGCPKCGQKKASKSNIIPKEEFLKRFNNDEIELIGDYTAIYTNTKFRCKKCGHEWECRPYHITKGHGCPKCAGNIKKTDEEFRNELKSVNPNIIPLTKYINNRTHVLCECKICGCQWNVKPANIFSLNRGCPKCSKNKKKTHQEFVDEMKRVNPNIEILGEYKNAATKILCRCKKDGYVWEGTPNAICHGVGCPKCNSSKGEMAVEKYLKDNNISYEIQKRFDDCKNIFSLPFDFYLPNNKTCIEYDGSLHYKAVDYFGGEEALKSTQSRDKIKTNYCKEHNIKLIRIPYWEFDNIEEILNRELEVR